MRWRPVGMGDSSRGKVDLFPVWLLILPFVVLWRNSNLLFSGLGYIDPWVYYGFFRNLALFKAELFPGTYYGSRLSWILPGYLVNRLFDPLVANYVLHLAVYYAAVLSLYFILARTINRPTALLTSTVFGLHPYVWLATGGDYTDGACIAYYLLAMALLTGAAGDRRARWQLALAGVSGAALVYCNIFCLIFIPIFPAYYLFRKRVQPVTNYLDEIRWFCMWTGAGAFALTMLLAVANYVLDHNFWFYAPSWHYVTSTTGTPSQHEALGLQWIWDAKWLLIPGLTLFAIPFSLARHFRRPIQAETRTALFFAVTLVFYAAIFGLMKLAGFSIIELPYYVSLLLPSVFLAFGALLLRLENERNGINLMILAAAVLVLVSPWWDLSRSLWGAATGAGAGWLIAFAAIAFLWRSMLPGSRAALATLLLATAACGSYALWTDKYIMRAGAWHTGTEGRDGFLRITEALAHIQEVKPNRTTRFWIDDQEPDGKELTSLSSVYLYGYTLLSRNFPSLPADVRLSSGSLVIIPSNRPDAAELARKTLEPRRLIPTLVARNTVERGDVRYFLNILRVGRDPGALQPLTLRSSGELGLAPPGPSAGVLPEEKWLLAGKVGTVQHTTDGVAVTTIKDRWGYAAYYGAPLGAPSDGTYLFTLRFHLLSGRITFGALKEDRSAWLAQAGTPVRQHGDVFIAECAVPLKAGEKIWLQTTNDQAVGDYRSVFVIQEIRAYRLKE